EGRNAKSQEPEFCFCLLHFAFCLSQCPGGSLGVRSPRWQGEQVTRPRAGHVLRFTPRAWVMKFISSWNCGARRPVKTFTPGLSTTVGVGVWPKTGEKEPSVRVRRIAPPTSFMGRGS